VSPEDDMSFKVDTYLLVGQYDTFCHSEFPP